MSSLDTTYHIPLPPRIFLQSQLPGNPLSALHLKDWRNCNFLHKHYILQDTCCFFSVVRFRSSLTMFCVFLIYCRTSQEQKYVFLCVLFWCNTNNRRNSTYFQNCSYSKCLFCVTVCIYLRHWAVLHLKQIEITPTLCLFLLLKHVSIKWNSIPWKLKVQSRMLLHKKLAGSLSSKN